MPCGRVLFIKNDNGGALCETRRLMGGRSDVSRVMCRLSAVSVIYLLHAVARGLKQPTPRQWTSNPLLPVYLALQHMGCAASGVAIGAGGLLPHLFTLTSPKERRSFSVTYPRRRRRLPVRKHAALCCPDFPLASGSSSPIDRKQATNLTSACLFMIRSFRGYCRVSRWRMPRLCRWPSLPGAMRSRGSDDSWRPPPSDAR